MKKNSTPEPLQYGSVKAHFVRDTSNNIYLKFGDNYESFERSAFEYDFKTQTLTGPMHLLQQKLPNLPETLSIMAITIKK